MKPMLFHDYDMVFIMCKATGNTCQMNNLNSKDSWIPGRKGDSQGPEGILTIFSVGIMIEQKRKQSLKETK